MKIAHTAGDFVPGTSVHEQREHFSVCCAENTDKIVAITGLVGASDEGESIGNALLFAAAPKLLTAVRLVLAMHDTRDASGPGGSVPGHRVHLDPMAERQLRAALAAAEWSEA